MTNHYDSYQDFEDSVNKVFCGALAERLMASELYVNVDGALYAIPADRGSNIYYDGEGRTIVQVSDEEILYNVEVDCSDESGKKWHEYYSFSLVLYEDGQWRFSEFGLTS